MHFVRLLHTLEVGLHELLQAWVRPSSFLHESDPVSQSEAILEEERAAQALHSTLDHDTDTIAEHVCFVHVMCSQNDDSVLLVRFEHIPELSAGAQVHS